MKRKPVLEVGIRDFDIKTVAFLSDIYCWIKPSLITVPVDLLFNGVFDLNPRIRVLFVFHVIALDFHRFFHICGKPSILLKNFGGEGSDMIALPLFKFKKNVCFFLISFGSGINGLEIESNPEFQLEFSV